MSPVRRKILLLIPSLGGGGAERVFSMLLAHLDRATFELHLGILEGQGVYLSEVPEDVSVHHLNSSRVRYALPGILRLVWKIRPRVILSTLGNLNLALILTRPLLPRGIGLIVREAAVPSAALDGETRHPGLYRWLYRHFYKRADKVVCLSDSMLSDLAERFNVPPEKLVRIYNPVDIERVRKLAESGSNPYSGPGPHLVAAGRLTRQKGFDILLEAMPKVLTPFPNAHLTVLGSGPLLADLLEQSKRLALNERVHFLGFQKNPWRYLKHADLFVFPSRYEGTSNVLLEVLTLATPVVASDCPGGTREIQASNPHMVLVPPGDSGALADAIINVCKIPRRVKGIEQVEEGLRAFDLRAAVREYSRLLEQL